MRPQLYRPLALGALAVTAALAIDGVMHVLAAQTPFGGPRPPVSGQAGGMIGWLLAKQSEFYREISSTLRAAKSDGSAVWGLLAISFAYGIFHAAGPGHGKAVISSYLVANRETARRGIALSFVSALLQSLIAVLIVAIGAWLLNVTARTMCGAERVIAIASYGLIAAFGARLVWTKGANFIRALQAQPPAPAAGAAAWARFSPWACGRVPAPFWSWCSRWRRACSGPALPRPSRWGSAPRSRWRRLPCSRRRPEVSRAA